MIEVYRVNPRRLERVTRDSGYGPLSETEVRDGHFKRAHYETQYGWPADPDAVWAARDREQEARIWG